MVITLVAGAVLVVIGGKARRCGDEPRCRRCQYNLAGSASSLCPECGAALTPRTIVQGLGAPHFVLLAVAGVLCPWSIATNWRSCVMDLRTTNWFQCTPLSWALSSADGGSRRALAEISRRARLDSVSAAQRQRIWECALRKQKAERGSVLESWLLLLGDLSRQMPAEQLRRMYEQFAAVEVRIAPSFRLGDPRAVDLYIHHRAPQQFGRHQHRTTATLWVDGESLGEVSVSTAVRFLRPPERLSGLLAQHALAAGRHTLRVDVRRELLQPDGPEDAPPLWSGSQTFEAAVDVLPPLAELPQARITAHIHRDRHGIHVRSVLENSGDRPLTIAAGGHPSEHLLGLKLSRAGEPVELPRSARRKASLYGMQPVGALRTRTLQPGETREDRIWLGDLPPGSYGLTGLAWHVSAPDPALQTGRSIVQLYAAPISIDVPSPAL